MTDETASKSEFARMLDVHPSRVTEYIDKGKIGPEALIGEGRTARIKVELAKKHLRTRLDASQRLGNGLGTKLGTAGPTVISSAPPAVPTLEPKRSINHDDVMLWSVLREMPVSAAWTAAGAGCTLQQCFDIHASLVREIPALFRMHFDVECNGAMEAVSWQVLAEEYGLGPVDLDALAAEHRRLDAAGAL